MRIAVEVGLGRHTDQLEQFVHARCALRFVPAQNVGHQLDILPHGHGGEQGDLLQHVTDAVAQPADVVIFDTPTVEINIAVGRLGQRVNHAQRGRFAAARTAHQHEKLALINGEVKFVHGGVVVVAFADVFEFD